MGGELLSNYKYFSCQSSCLLLLFEVCKNHCKKKTLVLVAASNAEMHFFEFI